MAKERKTYSEKLKDPRWQKKRLEILERDKWACTLCGDTTTTLAIHHWKYTGDPWEAPNEDLSTVCECCHDFEYTDRANAEQKLLAVLKQKHWTANDIIRLGDFVNDLPKADSGDFYTRINYGEAVFSFLSYIAFSRVELMDAFKQLAKAVIASANYDPGYLCMYEEIFQEKFTQE